MFGLWRALGAGAAFFASLARHPVGALPPGLLFLPLGLALLLGLLLYAVRIWSSLNVLLS